MSGISVETLMDCDAWDRIVKFLPEQNQETATKQVRAALNHVAYDKHFEAERAFDTVFALFDAIENTLLAQSATAVIVSKREQSGGSAASAKPLATVLGVRAVRDFVKSTKGYRICVSKCEDSRQIMREASLSNTSWKPVRVDKKTGFGTYYRGEPGMTTHSFRVVGQVESEVVALASVLLELDLYKEWFPFCYYSVVVAEESRFHKSSRFAIRLPWPLANREVAITGFGHDDLNHGRVVVKACTDPALGSTPSRKGNVMAELKIGGFDIEPVARSTTRITFFMNIDPHIPHLPTAVLNWTSGQVMWVMLWQLDKAAKKAMQPDSIYAKRRAERPEVYEYFVERAKEVLAGLPDEAPKP